MNITSKLLFPMLLVLALAPSLASAGGESGFYLGAGVGRSSSGDVEIDGASLDFDGDDSAYKVIAGFNLGIVPLLDLAVEGGYVDFGKPKDNGIRLDADGFDLFGLVGTALGPIGVFAKAGLINWDAEASFGSSSGSDDGTDPAYGVGARFQLMSFQVRGEYEYFDVDAADGLDLFSVSLLYTF